VSALTRAPVALFCVLVLLGGCKRKATQAECDALVDRYAELVVKDVMPDASPETLAEERAREKSLARGNDVFERCTADLTHQDYECAMRATSPDALEQCLIVQ
jgi:hypothetical protein